LRADHDAGHFARNPSPTQFCSIAPGDYFNRLLGFMFMASRGGFLQFSSRAAALQARSGPKCRFS